MFPFVACFLYFLVSHVFFIHYSVLRVRFYNKIIIIIIIEKGSVNVLGKFLTFFLFTNPESKCSSNVCFREYNYSYQINCAVAVYNNQTNNIHRQHRSHGNNDACNHHQMYFVLSLTCIEIITHSHGIVRECCKGDDTSQWGNGKFDPLLGPNPLTDRYQKLRM